MCPNLLTFLKNGTLALPRGCTLFLGVHLHSPVNLAQKKNFLRPGGGARALSATPVTPMFSARFGMLRLLINWTTNASKKSMQRPGRNTYRAFTDITDLWR